MSIISHPLVLYDSLTIITLTALIFQISVLPGRFDRHPITWLVITYTKTQHGTPKL